jgi:hypothetical protein
LPEYSGLSSDDGEALSQLQQESLDVRHQAMLDLSLGGLLVEPKESKDVGVLGDLLCDLGLGRGESLIEVGESLAFSEVQSALDLMDEHIARPPVLTGPIGIPEPYLSVVELLDKRDLMPPGQLCKAPLHNLGVGPGLRERSHVLEVARGHPHIREQRSQVAGEPVDDPRSPSLALLALKDLLPDVPVEQYELLVDAAQGTYPGCVDTLNQSVEGSLVALGGLRKHRVRGWCLGAHRCSPAEFRLHPAAVIEPTDHHASHDTATESTFNPIQANGTNLAHLANCLPGDGDEEQGTAAPKLRNPALSSQNGYSGARLDPQTPCISRIDVQSRCQCAMSGAQRSIEGSRKIPQSRFAVRLPI